jgi:hypothetical protein
MQQFLYNMPVPAGSAFKLIAKYPKLSSQAEGSQSIHERSGTLIFPLNTL